MGFLLAVAIGLILLGHKWFAYRNQQGKPQPFVVHLIDVIVMPALVFGWLLLVGLILTGMFGRQ